MPQLKILISGAGIAGCASAFWLSRLGHDITVVERFPTLRSTGLQVDLRGHGVEVMKRMRLEQQFRAKSAPETGVQVVDSRGRRWAYFPANRSGKGLQNFTTDWEIMRGDLCQLLHDACAGRVKYVFGKWIESFQGNNDDFVEVSFSDGIKDQFDLVIGADGQGSRTRKLMLGSNTPDQITWLGGMYFGYFTIPRQIQEGEEYRATTYMAPGSRFILTRRHRPDRMQVYLGCKTDSDRLKNARRSDVQEEIDAFVEIFRGAGWQTEDILKALQEDTDDFYCERLGVVKMTPWYQNRVVLVGDAGYCPTANTGMGTSSAIVGAYVLAGEISRMQKGPKIEDHYSKDELLMALKRYDEKFRPFMDTVQEGIAEGHDSWDWIAGSSFRIFIFNLILAIASLLRINILGRFALREDVGDWSLPDYEEMVKK
ncbi:hypothetical protein NECHADRAFT_86442 [Paecilomyces variotii No. 5]|uniref:FAD-binding domain-containing protein n=1 Tax=Byssochlamys spectabilis (strain No. 5 / NBRC 109023) TaxID=1356009 RepID=V5FL84_BYSSN|nr:hypothetical protein NECHADRAFT_86442 [Paecilomyces variotii No. 5]